MLLINTENELVGWFEKVSDMPERKEGDKVIKSLKEAKEQGYEELWVANRPVKERGERIDTPSTGEYVVIRTDSMRNEKNPARAAVFAILFGKTKLEDFFAEAKPYPQTDNPEKSITPKEVVRYSLRRGFIKLASDPAAAEAVEAEQAKAAAKTEKKSKKTKKDADAPAADAGAGVEPEATGAF